MKIGCFALIQPFTPLSTQFELIKQLGVDYADLTDNHDGASLGREFGFAATASLDGHPAAIKSMVAEAGITLTSVCAHANLLDPTSPERYGTVQIVKAIQLAHFLGVTQVITTEGDPKTDFGHQLTESERIFTIREKLQEPISWAKELGIELLIEPHGIVTDTVPTMSKLLDALGHEDVVGINLDTGNSWLGGGDPLEFVKTFGPRIRHVHWKDMGEEWLPQRGRIFGCGMGTLALGEGIVGIDAIVTELKSVGFDGPTTLEIAGEEAVRRSIDYLQARI